MRLIPLSYVISLNTLDGSSIPQFPLFTRPGGKKEGSSLIILVYPDAAVRRFFVRIEEARQQQRNPSQLPFLPRILRHQRSALRDADFEMAGGDKALLAWLVC